jgi:hypothetical protein
MSRNRFEISLRMLHFSDSNGDLQPIDIMRKISPLVTQLRERFQSVIIPEEDVCIDESLVPFRGRLAFKQYIKNNRHKFGIKLFKLCCKDGYTFDLKVYCGKEELNKDSSIPTKVVMQFM